MKIWLDDLRDPPDETWLVFRDARSAMFHVKHNIKGIAGAEFSIDYHLSEDPRSRNGYDFVSWMVDLCEREDVMPKSMAFHSSDNKMNCKMQRIWDSFVKGL